MHKTPDGWAIGDPPGPLPLYRREKLPTGRTIWITEGEKACEAARQIGLATTTSSHGAKCANKTNWTPLAGRAVVILPDNDKPGQNYALDVARILLALEPPAKVKIVPLPGLPEGGDIVEFIEEQKNRGSNQIRLEIKKLADKYDWLDPANVLGGPILTCLADIETRRVEWLWRSTIPVGCLTLLVGRPGEGKSFLTTELAAHVSTGREWPDRAPCRSGSVILISAEDDAAHTIKPRLEATGADARCVHLLSMVRRFDEDGKPHEYPFTLADVDKLEAALKLHRDCLLVVIDPIGSFVGGRTDTYRDNEVRAVLAPVARLAEKYGVAVLMVAHRRKAGSNYADDTAIGSRGFIGTARAVLHLSRDPANPNRRLLLPGKMNLCKQPTGFAFCIEGEPPRILWESGPVMMTADEMVRAENGEEAGRPATERSEALAWLGDVLGDGEPHKVSELREAHKAAGISASWRTVERAKNELSAIVNRDGFNGPCTWRLPPRSCHESSKGKILASGKNGNLQGIPAKIDHSCQNNFIRDPSGQNGFPRRSAEKRQAAHARRLEDLSQ